MRHQGTNVTRRALLLGIAGAAVICGVSYFNDAVMRQTFLVGNNMPFSVYGILVLTALLVNPVLGRVSRRAMLSGREMAVALALTLAACCIPGSGLMRAFPSSVVLPHHFAQTEAGWKDQGVVGLAPRQMLVEVTEENSSKVLNGFIQGLGVGDRHIALSDIPWSAWAPALLFWLPLILVFWIALIGLSLVIHKQWSEHEQLPYPIAQFTNSLLPGANGARAPIFGNRLFWLGAGAMLAIHTNNYLATWFPNTMVRV